MVTGRTTYGDYFPYGISQRVPNLEYAADVVLSGPYILYLGAPLALSANGLLASVAMVNGSAVTVNSFTGGAGSATAIGYNGMVPFDSTTKRSGWGRSVSFVASGANARTATVTGYDYLGSKVVEVITLNGTTTVHSLKAFQWIESVVFSSDSDTTTVNMGWGNKFGLPYTGQSMVNEVKNGAVAANAGTFTAGLTEGTAETSTNADVRGTYLPVTVLPDGSNTFEILYTLRRGNLHGASRYAG